MTQEHLTAVIVAELTRQRFELYSSDDSEAFRVGGVLNVVELAQAILKYQPDLIAALERARDYIDDCGAQAGAQAAIDDIEAVLAQTRS